MPSLVKHLGRPIDGTPWTNVIGLGRSIVALSTLVSLLVHTSNELFFLMGRRTTDVMAQGLVAKFSLFALVPVQQLWIAHLIAIVVLLAVVVGYRPRWLCIPHWYVAASFAVSCNVVDGGDQLAANIALLLVPVCLLDSRRSHWDTEVAERQSSWGMLGTLVAFGFVSLIKIQMCVVYLHAAAGKLAVSEWTNGTAVYYWLSHPVFGLPADFAGVSRALLSIPIVTVALTWGSILLEMMLAAAIFLPWNNRRKALFFTGIAFHATIILFHGLGSFFFSMAAGLVLYLLPTNTNMDFLAMWSAVRLRKPASVSLPTMPALPGIAAQAGQPDTPQFQ